MNGLKSPSEIKNKCLRRAIVEENAILLLARLKRAMHLYFI